MTFVILGRPAKMFGSDFPSVSRANQFSSLSSRNKFPQLQSTNQLWGSKVEDSRQGKKIIV